MIKSLAAFGLLLLIQLFPIQIIQAQDPITLIIKEGVKKVIRAVDLKIQRLQNETIWLQNAQKMLENKMSELKLTEISSWVEKQRRVYADYFEELWKVKAALAYYQKVKAIILIQARLVSEYKSSWALFKQDKNFTPVELDYIQQVYHGIMDESVKNMDQLLLVVSSFATQMSDAKRLEIINQVYDAIESNTHDLRQFNTQNKMLSIQRAGERGSIELVKRIYGLQ